MTKELSIETPTCQLRWYKSYDGYEMSAPKLQQLWTIVSGETFSEEWRDVPVESPYE